MAKREAYTPPPELRDDALPRGIFSPSQYSLYKHCGRAYEFRYVLGAESAPSASSLRGTAVHAGAELAHRHLAASGRPPPLEAARAAVSDAFDAERERVADWEGDTPGAVKDTAIALYATYHREALPTLRPVEVESHVVGRIGAVPVHAYLDLVDHVREPPQGGVEDPGTLVIADIKTSRQTWSEDDARRDPQLTAYAVLRGVPSVRVDNLVPLSKGPRLTRRPAIRTPAQAAVLVEDYEATVDLIKRGVFPMAPIDSWQCTPRCGYWARCRGRHG